MSRRGSDNPFVKIEVALKGVRQAIAGVGDLDESFRDLDESIESAGTRLGDAVGDFGGAVRDAGDRLMGIRGPALAAAGAFGAVSYEWNAGTQNIIAGTGATGDALRVLQGDMRAVARDVPQRMGEVGDAIAELDTRTDAHGETLRRAATDVLDFARVHSLEGGRAAADLGRLMAALEEPVERMPYILDLLTFASQETGIAVDSLIGHIVEAGPAFEEMGFGLERSIALFAQFERFGARPEEVLSSMNILMTRMAREGMTDLEEGFSNLIAEIEEAPTLLDAVNIAADAFGARVGGKVAEDIRAGRFEIDEFVESMGAAEGRTRETADAMLTWTDRAQMMRDRAVGVVGPIADVGTQLALATAAFPHVLDGGGRLIEFLGSVPAKAKAAKVALSGKMALLGPYGIAIAGASALLYAHSQRQEEVRAAANRLTSSLENQEGTVRDNTREWVTSELQQRDNLRALHEAGLTVDTVTSALEGNAEAQEQVRRVTGSMSASFGGFAAVLPGVRSESRDLAQTLMDLRQAMAHSEEQAVLLRRENDEFRRLVDDGVDPALARLAVQHRRAGDAAGEQADAVDALGDELVELTDMQETFSGAVQGFLDPMDAYTDALDEAREAAGELADSAEADFGRWIEIMEEQVAAQLAWESNLLEIAARVGPEATAFLAEMGPQAAGLVAAAVDGTEEEWGRLLDILPALTGEAAAGASGVMTSELDVMIGIAGEKGEATARELAEKLDLGVGEVLRIAQRYNLALGQIRPPSFVVTPSAGPGVVPQAEGGISTTMDPIIAGDATYMFAEAGTGGEAFIPFAPDKRRRSTAIWVEAGRHLGVLPRAAGGVNRFGAAAPVGARSVDGGTSTATPVDGFGGPSVVHVHKGAVQINVRGGGRLDEEKIGEMVIAHMRRKLARK